MDTAQVASKIIVALDESDLDTIADLVYQLAPFGVIFKVGLQTITRFGAPVIVDFIHNECNAQVFLDGKFCDTPDTVGAAAKAASDLGVKMFNVHISAGVEAMKAAVANKGDALVLAVTVLTSLSSNDLWTIGYVPAYYRSYGNRVQAAHTKNNGYIRNLVSLMVKAAETAGVDGIISSPQELPVIRRDSQLIKVTPGVRPLWASANDQKRITTPTEAIRGGADYIVIGCPITRPPSNIGQPADALKLIIKEIAEAIQEGVIK